MVESRYLRVVFAVTKKVNAADRNVNSYWMGIHQIAARHIHDDLFNISVPRMRQTIFVNQS